jgi:protein-tyrosine phosphatase
VRAADFSDFDLLLVMDRNNLRDVAGFRPNSGATARVALLGSFDPQGGEREVPDPYHDDLEVFETVYQQVERCCRGLLAAHGHTPNKP